MSLVTYPPIVLTSAQRTNTQNPTNPSIMVLRTKSGRKYLLELWPGRAFRQCRKPNKAQAATATTQDFVHLIVTTVKLPGTQEHVSGMTGADSNQTFARSNSVTNPSNCYKCEKPGHFAASCPLNNKPNIPYKEKKNQSLVRLVATPGRHPRGSNCEAVRKRKGGKGNLT